eukprot:3920961-Rhodomonas_salina.1
MPLRIRVPRIGRTAHRRTRHGAYGMAYPSPGRGVLGMVYAVWHDVWGRMGRIGRLERTCWACRNASSRSRCPHTLHQYRSPQGHTLSQYRSPHG